MRWRLPGVRRWWARVLEDESVQCVIARRRSGGGTDPVVGFALLVHDEARFAVAGRQPGRELAARVRRVIPGGAAPGPSPGPGPGVPGRRERRGERSWVELIAVHPDEGGRGIGSLLLRHCVDETTRRGHERLEALVAEANLGSRRLFEAGGLTVAATPPGVRVHRRTVAGAGSGPATGGRAAA